MPRRLASAPALKVERLTVSTSRRSGTLTHKALVSGHRYLVEASGTYRYGRKAGSVADAECSRRPGSTRWQRDRSLRADQSRADHLDLYVDGRDLQAQADNGRTCDARSHTYRWVYEAPRSGRVPFAVWDPNRYADNSGKLTVRVLDLGDDPASMTWKVPARSKAGATSPGLLQDSRKYVVTVSGTWRNGQGTTADAECALTRGTWRRDVDSYDVLAGVWANGKLVPQVSEVRTTPVGGGTHCDRQHRYSWVHYADQTSPLNVRVSDRGSFGDNTGALTVTVKPYNGSSQRPSQAPAPTPTATPKPITSPKPTPAPQPKVESKVEPEQVQVDSTSRSGARTAQTYPAGTSLRVTVRGVYILRKTYTGWVAADAECTISSGKGWWSPSSYQATFGGKTSPLGDLMVNGALVSWEPADGRGECDENGHEYTYDLTTTKAGPLSFVVADDSYGDNGRKLQVEVTPR